MKKLDILNKVEEIKQLVDDRYYCECEGPEHWDAHFEGILDRIEEIVGGIIYEKENKSVKDSILKNKKK